MLHLSFDAFKAWLDTLNDDHDFFANGPSGARRCEWCPVASWLLASHGDDFAVTKTGVKKGERWLKFDAPWLQEFVERYDEGITTKAGYAKRVAAEMESKVNPNPLADAP